MTNLQSKLWKLANTKIRVIGGTGQITRNPDAEIRNRAKTEGTIEWALMESTRLVSPVNDPLFTDEYCTKIITILEG